MSEQKSSRSKLRSETLVAVATCFAAIAAGLSVWTAWRQEEATYKSQLYSKQVDLIGPLYPVLVPFAKVVFPNNPNSEPYRHLLGDGATKLDFIAQAAKVEAELNDKIGVFYLTFPDTVNDAINNMIRGLDDMVTALKAASPNEAQYLSGYNMYTYYNNSLYDCIKGVLRAGQPVTESACSTPGAKK
jgi:hypothetical protein